VFYIFTIFGIYSINPAYLRFMSTMIQFFVTGFLLWKFRPFIPYKESTMNENWCRKYTFTQFDRQLIFACASFLFINVVLVELLTYLKDIPVIRKTVDEIDSKKEKLLGTSNSGNISSTNTKNTT